MTAADRRPPAKSTQSPRVDRITELLSRHPEYRHEAGAPYCRGCNAALATDRSPWRAHLHHQAELINQFIVDEITAIAARPIPVRHT